jgi:hypothetical protein
MNTPRAAGFMARRHSLNRFALTLVLFVLGAIWCPLRGSGHDVEHVKALFKDPPRQYSTGPLWVWNDQLMESEIRGTLRDLAGQQVKQVWVHPRPGLMTPYLSAEWFRLWRIALDEARRLDMNVWIYDENSYPSGFAGGFVPEAMPESRGRGLSFHESNAPAWSTNVLGIYRLNSNSFENVTARIKGGEPAEAGRYLVASEVRAGNSPWHGNRCYVNLLSPGVTEKFLEITLEAYRHEVGAEFGRRVPGVFTDEPNIRPVGNFAWSEILADEFRTRWGYDLLEQLPALTRPAGDWQKVRHNYYQVLNEQFIEHWSRPYHDYCESNHLEWTGHYWDHEWPNCGAVPDNMAMYAWHQRPAIDCLMNQYAEHTHAQFGNLRMVRELSSVANQLGMKRTLCEVYGAGGWDLRFEDMKRIGDWLEVLGVNTLDQHLSYVTIRGARKRDHPQSFSYHEPWWSAYHVSAAYFARLSAAMSQGEQVNRVLVLEPTTTAWMYQGEGTKLDKLGNDFCKLLMALEAAQIEYDIGDEDILSRHGQVKGDCRFEARQGPVTLSLATGAELKIGSRSYSTVVLPAEVENLNSQTVKLLEEYLQAAVPGKLLALGEPASRVDGATDERVQRLARNPGWRKVAAEELLATLAGLPGAAGFAIHRSAGDRGTLFHHRRQLGDAQLVFLANTSITARSAGRIESDLNGVEVWDLYSGKTRAYPCAKTGRGITADFDLPPCGSLLLFLSAEAAPESPRAEPRSGGGPPGLLETATPPEVRRLGPNVLTLDYVDVTAGGSSRTNIYTYAANQFVWKQNGEQRDPWDSAVQFKDELISKRFPTESGFGASYKFRVEGAVPSDLEIVIERPDLYEITCNGQPVAKDSKHAAVAGAQSAARDWWLDKSFGRIPIAPLAHSGENVVTISASPFTMFHELEPAYVLGDFTLKPVANGFVISADAGLELEARGWNQQGHPFYAEGVAYRERFVVTDTSARYRVVLPEWYGSVAGVKVNGRDAGFIDAPPWACDLKSALKRGTNVVEVTVFGTLKNTLGPHHGKPALGAAWPASFHQAPASGPPPGAEYSTVSYGLF